MSLPELDTINILVEAPKIEKYYQLVDEQFNNITNIIKNNSTSKSRLMFRIEYFLFLYMVEVSIRDKFMGKYTNNFLPVIYNTGRDYVNKMASECKISIDSATDSMKYLAFIKYENDLTVEESVYPKIMEFALLKADEDYDVPTYRKKIEDYLKPWTKQFVAYMESIYQGLAEFRPDYDSNKVSESTAISEDDVCYTVSGSQPKYKHLVCSECKKSMDGQKYVYYIYDFSRNAPLCMDCFERITENYLPIHYEKKEIQTGYVVGGGHFDYDMRSEEEIANSNSLLRKIINGIKKLFD